MICRSISFNNFRNIEAENCTFSDGVNLLWGNNAQGKSNMLEGVYFFARGKSFRGAKERELIHFGGDCAALSIEFLKDNDKFSVTLDAVIPQSGKKDLSRNGGRLGSIRDMIGDFRAVLFCPAHLTLVSGGPAIRRSFMDIAISQLYPAYLSSLTKYRRLLLQRNTLIKDISLNKSHADSYVWEAYAEQMAQCGAEIAFRRYNYMENLDKAVFSVFSDMTDGRETPEITYKSEILTDCGNFSPEDILTEGRQILFRLLTENIQREIKYGATLFGVQKDDIQIKLNGKEARLFASQGQMRSLALAMKLAEGEMSAEISGEYPVFLLDDVLSELDRERRDFILSKLCGRQIIVTACEPELFSGAGADRLIHIENGKIIETE